MFGGDFRRSGGQRAVVGDVEDELVLEALGIREQQRIVAHLRRDAVVLEVLLPELKRLGRGDPPDDSVDHPGAGNTRRRSRVLEEREIHARRAVLVAVEQVVDRGFVLVDGALDHAHAQHACVELDVARGVAGDRADVVDSV